MVEPRYIPQGIIHTPISADLPAGIRASIQLATSPLVLAVEATEANGYLSQRFDKPVRLNGADVNALEHGGLLWYLKTDLDSLREDDVEFVYEREVRVTADLPESVRNRLLGISQERYVFKKIVDEVIVYEEPEIVIESSSSEKINLGDVSNTITDDEEELSDGTIQELIENVEVDFELPSPIPSRIPDLSLEELAVNYHETREDRYATEIYQRLNPLMCSIAWRYLKSEEDVTDIVAEKFAQIFLPDGLEKFVEQHKKTGGGNFKAYLGISVRNAALNITRDKQRRNNLLDRHYVKEQLISKPSIEREMYEGQLKQEFREAISELSPGHRDTLLLRSQDLSYREIADTLGVELGTVMSRISRGKAILRKRFPGLARFCE